jgi:hypothetical protein
LQVVQHLDLQATQTFATLDLDGTITRSAGSSALTITGASDLGGSITTSGSQTYTGAITLTANTTLTTTDSNITFSSTVDGDGTARDLTIDMDNSGEGADGTVQFVNTVGANDDLDVIDITGNLNLDAAISNTTSLSVSGTSNLGADVTTSSTQTYTGAVVLSTDITLTTTDSNITFGSTIDSDSTSRDLTLTLGSGSASITGIVGTTSLADIILNSSATFNAAITATNLTIAANKTATVKDDVTIASTIALSGSSTLEVINTSAMTIAGTITDTGTGNSITVNDNDANTAPNIVTFSGTVAADTLYIGTATTAGHAKFTGTTGPTITSITITGGNHANEDSTATFNYALTSTDITLDDNTGDAYIIFAENNSVTIAGTIDGAADGEGNLVVSGQIKTFSGNVGSTNSLNFIVQASAVFNGTLIASSTTIEADFSAPSLVISGDITINANITTVGIQTYAGNVIIGSNVNLTTTNNKITFNGTVNSQSSETNNLTIDVGSSEVEFNGIVGGAVNGGLGAIDITGALNLDAAITSAASLTVSTTSNLAANVTTAGTQIYGDGISSGAVVLEVDTTLTTTDSNITFNGTVRSDSSDTPRDLTINLDANSNGTQQT